MKLRLSNIIGAAAGVVLFDLLFCGLVAPKILKALDLRAQKRDACHCGGGCNSCAKNVTDRGQVVDLKQISAQGVSVSV